MEDELHKRVIGQEQALQSVSQAIRRTRAGLKDPKRPSGSFIFLGPSGVGKTELAKTLAEFLFGDEQSLIALDMSEYMEKHTVSRLVGSPPGYVGYEEGGQLTEAVRRKPFSVVLFDEIEKAHPDVFNTLLQILEEGRLTDAQGRSVDFRNTVLIMTSNLGTQDLRKATVGFGKADEAVSYEKMKEKVNDALKLHFRPEFLNRIDETIVFHELSKAEVTQIVDLMIKRTSIQLEGQGIGIELTDAAKLLLVERGYDPTLGARPLRRAIQRLIEDPLSERLLYKQFRAGEIVIVDAEPDPESPKGEQQASCSGRSRASSHRRSSWPRPVPPRPDPGRRAHALPHRLPHSGPGSTGRGPIGPERGGRRRSAARGRYAPAAVRAARRLRRRPTLGRWSPSWWRAGRRRMSGADRRRRRRVDRDGSGTVAVTVDARPRGGGPGSEPRSPAPGRRPPAVRVAAHRADAGRPAAVCGSRPRKRFGRPERGGSGVSRSWPARTVRSAGSRSPAPIPSPGPPGTSRGHGRPAAGPGRLQ